MSETSMEFTERMFETVKPDLYRLVLEIEQRAREFDIPIPVPHGPDTEPADSGIRENACGFWVGLGDLEVWGEHPDTTDEPVDVTIEIVDAEEEEPGCALTIDIVANGGEIIGGVTPENFSDDLWIRPDHPDPAGELLRRIPGPTDEQATAIVRLVLGYWRQQRARREKARA